MSAMKDSKGLTGKSGGITLQYYSVLIFSSAENKIRNDLIRAAFILN
jgi:hypothetical protein